MRVVFAGTPEVALPSLDAVVASDHEVIAVVTRPDAPSGRGRTLHPSPVGARAAELGLETLKPDHPRDAGFRARLTELAPDCCAVVAYGALVPERVLAIPRHGWVNLHFSLLPRWRGAAPVQHAVWNGDAVTGATTFRLVKAMDAGPVYRTLTRPIGPTATSGELLAELAGAGAGLLVETLDAIEAGADPVPQPDHGVTLAPKIDVADAQIDWTRPAAQIDRMIRACSPSPGAWTLFRGDRFKINTAAPVDQTGTDEPGTLVITKRSVRVATGSGLLELGSVQPPGRKAMNAADWSRGVTFEPGERLG